jgi:endonuclease III
MLSIKKTQELLHTLDARYGKIAPFLDHSTPFQLLIAVILSAQTTDAMVNKVTPDLFALYPDASTLKTASEEEVAILIRRVNYYRTKAKNIILTAKLIDEEFNGRVPDNIKDLTTLAGVGRKVANVIVAEIYNIPEGIVVDTHIKRVSKRVGWTDSMNPTIIERDLIKVWPVSHYVNSPKHLILIGRNYCFPKTPNCPECPINKYCQKRIDPPL